MIDPQYVLDSRVVQSTRRMSFDEVTEIQQRCLFILKLLSASVTEPGDSLQNI